LLGFNNINDGGNQCSILFLLWPLLAQASTDFIPFGKGVSVIDKSVQPPKLKSHDNEQRTNETPRFCPGRRWSSQSKSRRSHLLLRACRPGSMAAQSESSRISRKNSSYWAMTSPCSRAAIPCRPRGLS